MKEELVLLRKDVLVKPLEYQDVNKSEILLVEEERKDDAMGFYEVLQVSSDVTMVRQGDTVVLEWGRHTLPIRWDGELCAVTSEDDIVAVLE